MIQAVIDLEVEAFIESHSGRVGERGRRLVVKNGSLPAREILTGAGPVEINKVGCATRVKILINERTSLLASFQLTAVAIEQ